MPTWRRSCIASKNPKSRHASSTPEPPFDYDAAAYALELLASSESVPSLVACLRRASQPRFASDEILLSTAAVLGMMPRFYTMYAAFMEDEAAGLALLGDAAAEQGLEPAAFAAALSRLLAEPSDGVPISRLILERSDSAAAIVLAEAALDPALGYRGLRFFIAAFAALEPLPAPR